MNPALLTYNIVSISQREAIAFIDSRQEVRNWHAPYPGTLLVVTEGISGTTALMAAWKTRFPGELFVVTNLLAFNTDGYMPKQFWEMLNQPTDSGRWPKTEAAPGAFADLFKAPSAWPHALFKPSAAKAGQDVLAQMLEGKAADGSKPKDLLEMLSLPRTEGPPKK